MTTNNLTFFSDYLVSSLSLSVPLTFAALGGLWSERSGVLNIGLEGMILTGAFVSATGVFLSGNVLSCYASKFLKQPKLGTGFSA